MIPAPIALTCGEPAGIGPDIAPMLWQALRDEVAFFFIGDPNHLPADTPWVEISDPAEVPACIQAGLPVLRQDMPGVRTAGAPQAAQAQGVVDAIARAVALTQSGSASALCTLPIHKQALQEGCGFAYPGHTEFLAHLAGGQEVVMMLASDQLRVVPVTIHIPLQDVSTTLTPALLEARLRITAQAMQQQFGMDAPRLAVAGLNPHAGEGGRMGQEEITVITPVLDKLRAEGMILRGPLSADTMFHPAARATYDVAVCMYHDQALIPIKTLDFDRGVNVTLGLPFIRTSPDHGTAFDIAGTDRANPSSSIEALMLAWRMAGGNA